MKNVIMFALAMLGICAMAGANSLPQEEFDVIVDREMFKFRHHDDWFAAIDYWKTQGATDEMFAEAYAKIARRTMNAPEGSRDAYKCHTSIIDGLRIHATDAQLTNLVFLARHAPLEPARSAVRSFHARKKGTPEYLDFAEGMLNATNRPDRVIADVLVTLDNDESYRSSNDVHVRERIANMARKGMKESGPCILTADRLLVRYDSSYRNSPTRKSLVRRILNSPDSESEEGKNTPRGHMIRYFKAVKKEMESL